MNAQQVDDAVLVVRAVGIVSVGTRGRLTVGLDIDVRPKPRADRAVLRTVVGQERGIGTGRITEIALGQFVCPDVDPAHPHSGFASLIG